MEAHCLGPLGHMSFIPVPLKMAIFVTFQLHSNKVQEWSIQDGYAALLHGVETQQAICDPGGIQSCNIA